MKSNIVGILFSTALLASCVSGCGSSPVNSFKRYIASQEDSNGPGKKIAGSDRFDVRKSDSLAMPFIGIHHWDELAPIKEFRGIVRPVITQSTVRFEFYYRGDGKNWEINEGYVTTVKYNVLQDDAGIGAETGKTVLGKRVKIQ